VTFIAGDMLDPSFGEFDHVIAMDSLIHYRPDDTVRSISGLADRVSRSIQFTFAPRTPLLAGMHAVGKLFPRSNRSPEIVPVGQNTLVRKLGAHPTMQDWAPGATYRATTGFYISQALELKKK
jgi:magnesium-protoporphyrin O-methyltransferase